MADLLHLWLAARDVDATVSDNSKRSFQRSAQHLLRLLGDTPLAHLSGEGRLTVQILAITGARI